MKEKIDLFVPGRLCLVGEHSDWAGFYKSINANIVPGQAIVTGIEQGIYATAVRDDRFIVDSQLPFYEGQSLDCEMDLEVLKRTACEGGFFSYVAGVASYVYEHYNVGGLHITVTRMDLPIKSGLSSSAAICVLVARAFNELYGLNLTKIGEMLIAYDGEQRTPSRCGRLDQACAFGINPVHMVFDGTQVYANPINIKKAMHFVIADLNSNKDTIKILSDLNKCYPFAQNDLERKVQKALGKDNEEFVSRARTMIEKGELEEYGRLMDEYQEHFDNNIAPASPKELEAPILHRLLSDTRIREFVLGAKGVGSQGDGTVQFLCSDSAKQKELIEYLKNEYSMEGINLTLRPRQLVNRAIIPVAGFGTRLYPTTKVLKKDLLPVLDRDGILKPVLIILLEQLIQAGIEEICLVIGKGEKKIYDNLFEVLPEGYSETLSKEKKNYDEYLQQLSKKITYIEQDEKRGFGHAVYLARNFCKKEPVLLLLGDMVYHSYNAVENCMKQMINAYEEVGKPVVSLQRIKKEDAVHYGMLHGSWIDSDERLMKVDRIVEKPSLEFTVNNMNVIRKDSDENYYAVFGQYILTEEVFEILEGNIANNITQNNEIQLTSALEETRRKTGMFGYVVDGKSYDIGLPKKYAQTMYDYYYDTQTL